MKPCQVLLLGLLVAAPSAQPRTVKEPTMEMMEMKKLTPILFVEQIEPCLGFWIERLGFKKTVEVPEGDQLGFVILSREGAEVMLQSRASLEKDIPVLAQQPFHSPTVLYIQVADLDEIVQRLEGVEVVVPVRKTFYGAREIFIREPCGTVVAFSVHE